MLVIKYACFVLEIVMLVKIHELLYTELIYAKRNLAKKFGTKTEVFK